MLIQIVNNEQLYVKTSNSIGITISEFEKYSQSVPYIRKHTFNPLGTVSFSQANLQVQVPA